MRSGEVQTWVPGAAAMWLSGQRRAASSELTCEQGPPVYAAARQAEPTAARWDDCAASLTAALADAPVAAAPRSQIGTSRAETNPRRRP